MISPEQYYVATIRLLWLMERQEWTARAWSATNICRTSSELDEIVGTRATLGACGSLDPRSGAQASVRGQPSSSTFKPFTAVSWRDSVVSYRAPDVREWSDKATWQIDNLTGFDQRMSEVAGGSFGRLLETLHRTLAAAANTATALGTATAKVVAGGLDDWGRAFVKTRETYTLAARYAIRETMRLGLPLKLHARVIAIAHEHVERPCGRTTFAQ
jgi:hypothetical protein